MSVELAELKAQLARPLTSREKPDIIKKHTASVFFGESQEVLDDTDSNT